MKTLIISAAIAALGLAIPMTASAQGSYYGAPVYGQGYGNGAGQSYGGGNGYAGSIYTNMTGALAGYGMNSQKQTSTRYGDTLKNSSGVEYTSGTVNGYGVNAAGGCATDAGGCAMNGGAGYGLTSGFGSAMGGGYGMHTGMGFNPAQSGLGYGGYGGFNSYGAVSGSGGFNQGGVNYAPLGFVGGPVMTQSYAAPAPQPTYAQPTYSQPVYSAPAVPTYSAPSQMAPCPAGTTSQADGTCLSTGVTSLSSVVVPYMEPTPVYTAPAYTAPSYSTPTYTTTCGSTTTPGYTMNSSADFNNNAPSYSGSCSQSVVSQPAPIEYNGYDVTPYIEPTVYQPIYRK